MLTPAEHSRFLTIPPVTERAARVVLVDSDAAERDVLRKILEGDGCECVLLSDGDELMRVCAEFEPDLLLVALDLPSTNGLELCGDVRSSDPGRHLPLILLGSGADEQRVAAGLLAGADDFVTNFDRVVELRARIHVQLRNKRLLDTLQRVRSERDLLRRDAQIDPLTGLLNRRSLEHEANQRWHAGERFGVLFMDLDNFKFVNDRYGHEVGDRVLIAVADVLKAGLRPGDAIGRFGGEEFVALIAGAGTESVRLVGERLRRQVAELPRVPDGPHGVTISVGATLFDPQRYEEVPHEVFKRADMAMYAAKHAGKNRVVLIPSAELGSGFEPLSPPSAPLTARMEGTNPSGEVVSR